MLRYWLTIFLGAFLLFEVQPLIGKYILPWFGGTPAVWTTCMLLFQILLLAGYAYAHLLCSRLAVRRQGVVHLVLLAVSLVSLPIIPSIDWQPSDGADPSWRILGLLTATIGLPYFVLASTSPLLQNWFASQSKGRSPYRLYSLSNAGSLLALVSYTTLIEPNWSVAWQAKVWSGAYIVFAVICGWCAVRVIGAAKQADAEEPLSAAATSPEPLPSTGVLLLWLALSACGSTLLLATTNQMCQEVAVVPVLWIVPLAVYLLSFIIAFDSPRWYRREVFGVLLAVGAVATLFVSDPTSDLPNQLGLVAVVGVYSLTLFAGVMICHGELARSKPAACYLTMFYLLVAAGGALGGLFVALWAPLMFPGYWEFQLALATTCVLIVVCLMRDRTIGARQKPITWSWRILGIIYCFVITGLLKQAAAVDPDTIERTRDFYGVLKVANAPAMKDPTTGQEWPQRRVLLHGRTQHGSQLADPAKRRWPTTYYGPASGVGLALNHHPARASAKPEEQGLRIGAVGLGVGTITAYAREHDELRFYEIDPGVERMARKYFTFLKDAPRKPQVVLGDGRVQLEAELSRNEPQNFDILVLDAFSSDAIPLHLLTLEFFETCWKHLKPDGLYTVHISNRHVDLRRLFRGLAERTNKRVIEVNSTNEPALGVNVSEWLILTTNQAFLETPAIKQATMPWPAQLPPPIVWTDDRASIWQVLLGK